MNVDKPVRQRLVVFLDGTWNNKDDSTNVLNIFNRVPEGLVQGGIRQRKMYDEGVGTGVLDSISGGAFGDGLEINIREAYDWLVEHFNDEGEGESYRADEIYVFGFSRGAYTARSLVGFIARCGLLRRGAPLMVNQLWEGYGNLERQKQEEESIWDELLNKRKFRQLEELVDDPWKTGSLLDAKPYNNTEKLLVQWSRRVPIHFVGVYDTVGALGLDALAIPGLRGKAGRLHNLRPSSIIRNFCHALAIDEHRSGFQHTPLVEYIPHDIKPPGRPGLKQRWFVGAHSNVGGGYEDNSLAQAPLDWMLREAHAVGLEVEPSGKRTFYPPNDPPPLPPPRDSYAEFAWPIGTYVLRSRRNYRRVVPPDEARAKRGEVGRRWAGTPMAGFSLHSEEAVDDSVWDYARANPAYAPPNLVEYAGRSGLEDPRVAEVAGRAVQHDWPPRQGGGYTWLACWALLAGIGAIVVDGVFLLFAGSLGPRDWLAAALVVIVAILVDWGEARLNLKLAVGRGKIWHRALADSIFWTRAVVVILFVAGALGVAAFLFCTGWNSGEGTLGEAFLKVAQVAAKGWLLVPLVLLVMLLATLLDDEIGEVKEGERPVVRPRKRWRRLISSLGWLAGVGLAGSAIVFLGRSAWNIVEQAGWVPRAMFELRAGLPAADELAAGRYLFLVVAIAYLARAFFWVGEPMGRANLGSMGALMFKRSGEAVLKVLNRWQVLLERRWNPNPQIREEEARIAVRAAVKEGLWRDLVGFIPAYNLVLCYGLYFASSQEGWHWLASPWRLWLILPLVSALADAVETASHLVFLGDRGLFRQPSDLAVRTVFVATLIKFAAFIFAVAMSLMALFRVGWRILLQEEATGGWRGALAATFVLTAIGLILASTVAGWRERHSNKQ